MPVQNPKLEYTELSKGRISDKRNVVISKCSKGGFTVAQQIETDENGKTTSLFMKGALHVDTVEGLYNMRDAVNAAISSCEVEILKKDNESADEDNENWDC
jgi:hypothetical protein